MFAPAQLAYRHGEKTALDAYGLKTAGWMGQGINGIGKVLKWGGRAAGVVPGFGTAANAVLGGAGGLAQGFANGEGIRGGLLRAGTNIATGSIPGGAGIAAGVAGDMAVNKLLAPKGPQGPAVGPMPGMMGQAHLPGMAM